MPQGRRRWGKGVGEWNRPVGGYGREWSAGQTREDLTSSEGVPLPGCTADAAGTAFQQKWRFQVGEWNLPSFKNRWWIHKFKTHPTSRAKPSWGPRLAQSLPVCDLGCRIFQHSAPFLTAELPSRFLSSVVFFRGCPVHLGQPPLVW